MREILRVTLDDAVRHLRRGGLLIYPTETAYALGCDATNPAAVRAIFQLKGRSRGKPLPLIVASRAMAERYARFTPLARRLAKQHWPGALTIVLPPFRHSEGRARGISHHGTAAALAPSALAHDGTLALRVSSHPIARALSRRLGRPIISTSANRSGSPPCYSARAALRSLQLQAPRTHRDDILAMRPHAKYVSRRSVLRSIGQRNGCPACIAVFDVGILPRRKPSVIVDGTGDHPRVLRKGAVAVSMLGDFSAASA